MDLVKDIFTFMWAVLNGWAGYATGGIIVALVAVWHLVRDKPIRRSLGMGLAILFLCMAVFRAWQDQYHKANGQTSNTAQLKPKLESHMLEMYTWRGVQDPESTSILLVTRILNSGGPSIVSRTWISAEVDGEKYRAELAMPPNVFTLSCGKSSKTFYIQDLLTTKATVEPIPAGGGVSGFIAAQINVNIEKLHDPGTVIELKLEDVTGAVYVEQIPFSMAMNAGTDMARLGTIPGMK